MRSLGLTSLMALLIAAGCGDDDGGRAQDLDSARDGGAEPSIDGGGVDFDGGTALRDAATGRDGSTSADGGVAPVEAPDAKPLALLTAGESVALCQWILSRDDRTVTDQQRCTREGAVEASKLECERARDVCLTTLDPWDQVAPEQCTSYRIPERLEDDCPASIGEVKACIGDLMRATHAAERAASCDQPGSGEVTLPESCQSIEIGCFDILDSLPSR